MTSQKALRIADCGLRIEKQTVLQSAIRNPQSAFKLLLLFICLLVTLAPTTSAQENATPTPEASSKSSSTGTITGRVVGDDGRPLSDAAVYAYGVYNLVPGTPLTAMTDGEGKFQLANLSPGLYTVTAIYPSYVNTLAQNFGTDIREGAYHRVGDFVDIKLVKGGVITGTVRDANNEAVVAVAVRATLVRDAQGRAPRFPGFNQPVISDDRGVYRIYGLSPGTYIVSAGGNVGFYGLFNAYEGDAATFYPSSATRDTAAEVAVRGGDEAANIDIRYRAERGHTISGTISGMKDLGLSSGISIVLRHAASSGFETSTYVQPMGKPGFAFNGIADGEYELTAQQGSSTGETLASTPRHVTVKGADVSGIDIPLAPLASIEGRAVLEPASKKENCADPHGGTFFETLIHARRAEKLDPKEIAFTYFLASGNIPNEQGDFLIRNLRGGNYRLGARLPSEARYVRSINLPAALARPANASAKSAEAKSASVPSILTLKSGERLTGVTVQIAQDGATLRGRVVAASEGAALPANLKVYLVPVERERAEDTLRYSEASIEGSGTFSFNNLAPGRYLLLARPSPESESVDRDPRPLAWDADARARLRREAEAANNAIELQPCQRTSDYVLRYALTQATTKP